MMAPYRSNVERDAQPSRFSQSSQASFLVVYLVDIALLLAAGLVSSAIQERRYSLKYLASAPT